MEAIDPGKITGLLKAWVGGDVAARELLIPIVYNELHRLAHRYRRRAGAGETMQTSALVHEAYIRMVDIHSVDWQDRIHFFSVSSQLMRRILVDSARASSAAKRGGPALPMHVESLDKFAAPGSVRSSELIALDDALSKLGEIDPRRARNVELRVFGGLTVEETAELLALAPQTVMRDWKLAKSWLLRELSC